MINLLVQQLGDGWGVFMRVGQADEVLVYVDGLVQPLEGLVQVVSAAPNTKTVSAAIAHSFLCDYGWK